MSNSGQDDEDESPRPATVRVRLAGGPRDGEMIETEVVNGVFLRSHAVVLGGGFAAIYQSPLQFEPSSIVEFEYQNIVTCDASPSPHRGDAHGCGNAKAR